MPAKPLLFDYFCCQGGASAGYVAAGWRVLGIDKDPQPNYPYEFVQADALAHMMDHGHKADAFHFSCPCQRYTKCQRIMNREHPDLIAPTRELAYLFGKPYVMENVEEAEDELMDPILLCGQSFGLRTYRHRLFESNVIIRQPEHEPHRHPTVKMGRPLGPNDFYHAVGNFSGVELVRQDLRVPWMNRDGIRECIPPAYAEHVGTQLIRSLS